MASLILYNTIWRRYSPTVESYTEVWKTLIFQIPPHTWWFRIPIRVGSTEEGRSMHLKTFLQWFWCSWRFGSHCFRPMAPHSSTLAWKTPWTEEPGRLQSMGSLRVRHDWATSLSLFTFMHWRRKWQPTAVFLPGESQGWGSLVGAVYGVAQSRTRLKWLSSSSSSRSFIVSGLTFRSLIHFEFCVWC